MCLFVKYISPNRCGWGRGRALLAMKSVICCTFPPAGSNWGPDLHFILQSDPCVALTNVQQFSPVQIRMVSVRSEKPICALPPLLSDVSPKLPVKQFQCSCDWLCPFLVFWRKFVKRFLSPRLSPPDINGVMTLALYPQVVSQASQHFRSSETTCDGRFACAMLIYLLAHFLLTPLPCSLDAQPSLCSSFIKPVSRRDVSWLSYSQIRLTVSSKLDYTSWFVRGGKKTQSLWTESTHDLKHGERN